MSDARALQDESVSARVSCSELEYRGRVWDIRRDTFAYNDSELERDYVAHTGAAAVVALDDEGRVLLIQQYRHPIRTRDWEIPAGLLDVEGEAPEQTARRELAEEADMQASEWTSLISAFTSPGGSDEIIHVFLARGLSRVGEAFDRGEEEADIRVEWVPLADAVTAVLEGRMRNNILAVGVLAASERLRRAGAGR